LPLGAKLRTGLWPLWGEVDSRGEVDFRGEGGKVETVNLPPQFFFQLKNKLNDPSRIRTWVRRRKVGGRRGRGGRPASRVELRRLFERN
jgi:hypothetical protein